MVETCDCGHGHLVDDDGDEVVGTLNMGKLIRVDRTSSMTTETSTASTASTVSMVRSWLKQAGHLIDVHRRGHHVVEREVSPHRLVVDLDSNGQGGVPWLDSNGRGGVPWLDSNGQGGVPVYEGDGLGRLPEAQQRLGGAPRALCLRRF